MTLTCDPLDYVEAGAALVSASQTAEKSRRKLLADLATDGGMAGDDEAGSQFAEQYDDLVDTTFVAFRRAQHATDQLGTLIHSAGLNYARADQPGADVVFPPPPAHTSVGEAIAVPPSSNGSGESDPWGWSLLSHTVGYLWPGGDSSRLRSSAAAWRLAAAGFETAEFPLVAAESLLIAQNTPDSPLAVSACSQVRNMLGDIAGYCRDLGSRCEEFAENLDTAHEQAHALLEEFLWESALLGTISAAGTVFTAGGAAAGGASGFSANVVRYGAKIAAVLRAFVESSGVVGRALALLADRVRQSVAAFDSMIAARGVTVEAIAPWTMKVKAELALELGSAEVWPGRYLPVMDGPINGFLVKRDAAGAITNYSWYDADGIAVSRVDLTGAAHNAGNADVPTPHVVDVIKNINPSTGEIFARTSSRSIRPALSEELPQP